MADDMMMEKDMMHMMDPMDKDMMMGPMMDPMMDPMMEKDMMPMMEKDMMPMMDHMMDPMPQTHHASLTPYVHPTHAVAPYRHPTPAPYNHPQPHQPYHHPHQTYHHVRYNNPNSSSSFFMPGIIFPPYRNIYSLQASENSFTLIP